jgi:hypothetical protein
MGEVTLKVPAEYVEAFRENVYSRLATEGDALEIMAAPLAFPDSEPGQKFIGGDPDKIERQAVNVLKATRNIAALVEVMEQLGWTDPIEGDVELTAAPKVLGWIMEGCLVDVGSAVNGITEDRPFSRVAFDAHTARGAWLADRLAEVESSKAGAA